MRVDPATAGTDARRVGGWAVPVLLAMLAGCQAGPADPVPPSIPGTDPVAQQTPPPDYPLALFCGGVGGQVILMIDVGVDGTPTHVRTENSSRRSALDAAAIAAVRTWRFKPASRRGQPVASKLRVPVTFTPPVMRPDVCFRFDEERNRAAQ